MTCSRTSTEVGPGDLPPDGEADGLADPDDHDDLELMMIGENTVPILSEEIVRHWHEPRDGDGERFMCVVATSAIGFADPSRPALVTGMFPVPDRGEVLPCRAPDGREFLGRVTGVKVEEGHLDIGFEVVETEGDR